MRTLCSVLKGVGASLALLLFCWIFDLAPFHSISKGAAALSSVAVLAFGWVVYVTDRHVQGARNEQPR